MPLTAGQRMSWLTPTSSAASPNAAVTSWPLGGFVARPTKLENSPSTAVPSSPAESFVFSESGSNPSPVTSHQTPVHKFPSNELLEYGTPMRISTILPDTTNKDDEENPGGCSFSLASFMNVDEKETNERSIDAYKKWQQQQEAQPRAWRNARAQSKQLEEKMKLKPEDTKAATTSLPITEFRPRSRVPATAMPPFECPEAPTPPQCEVFPSSSKPKLPASPEVPTGSKLRAVPENKAPGKVPMSEGRSGSKLKPPQGTGRSKLKPTTGTTDERLGSKAKTVPREAATRAGTSTGMEPSVASKSLQAGRVALADAGTNSFELGFTFTAPKSLLTFTEASGAAFSKVARLAARAGRVVNNSPKTGPELSNRPGQARLAAAARVERQDAVPRKAAWDQRRVSMAARSPSPNDRLLHKTKTAPAMPAPTRRAGSPPPGAARSPVEKARTQPQLGSAAVKQVSQKFRAGVFPEQNLIHEVLANSNELQRYAAACFEAYDTNGDGSLNFEELSRCMKHMNTALGIGDFTERHVMHYLRRFDIDGNGLLSREEYEQLYRSLLLVKSDELEPAGFSREAFISRRKGRPEDHYKLQGIIGAGSFGIVRKVLCRQSKVQRVMKVVDKQKALSGGYPLTLIMEEIDKLKSLDHPAVLRLFEYYADAKALYLITDLLQGGDLLEAVESAYAKRKPLAEPWVRDVFRQVCEGVAYCHAKGVMHKDLKLENIMLCSFEPPEAVVIDVGLAELFPPSQAESFKSADAAGTLATMAPEVIKGSFASKCDVWSLGCCLFALLCQRPRRLLDTAALAEKGELKDDEGPPDDCYYDYFYPYRPPDNETRSELKAYLERQKRGPDLARLVCSAACDDLIELMLTFEAQSRPALTKVLTHKWLRESKNKDQVLAEGQIDSLLQFHRTNALAQAVLLDMASQLPLGKLRELTNLFESMDKDGNGMLDGNELAEALQKAGLEAEQAQQAASRLARDGGGTVEFSRFVAALMPSCQDLLQRSSLENSFSRLDADGDGFISLAELQQLLERSSVAVLDERLQSLAKKEGASQTPVVSKEYSEDEELQDEKRSRSTRLRAAKAAQHAFDTISGEGRVRVSFESFQRHLGDFLGNP